MNKKRISILMVVFIIMGMTTGCGKEEGTEAISGYEVCDHHISGDEYSEIDLAVIVGVHSNCVGIPLNSASINNALYNSCYTHGSVSFIICDGNPKVFYQADIPKPNKNGLSNNKKDSIADNCKKQLIAELMKSTPEVPEVDTLKAINQASHTLKINSSSIEKTLIVMDSGLSTVGYVDFTKGLLRAETRDIVQALKDAEALPDLSNVSVVWMFCGQTASPQKELSEKQKAKLQEIWEAILTESGALSVTFTSDISSEIADSSYPQVAIVDVEEREIEVAQSVEPIKVEIKKPIKTKVLVDNESVQFVGNKAIFVDEDFAYQVIEDFSKELIAHPDNKVYVIGTTATGNEQFCKQLSKDRSQAVCNVLISYGVPKEQLIPMGLGYTDPWHIKDVDENGCQIEKYACQNRKVLIVDVNGEDAAKLN
ncbi:MAG: OmpA family protein [Lachnospiraceae bacterium]|nr:OmpA family protein [Lachnospiraceae bacterium]